MGLKDRDSAWQMCGHSPQPIKECKFEDEESELERRPTPQRWLMTDAQGRQRINAEDVDPKKHKSWQTDDDFDDDILEQSHRDEEKQLDQAEARSSSMQATSFHGIRAQHKNTSSKDISTSKQAEGQSPRRGIEAFL